jgi:LysM repeat protein
MDLKKLAEVLKRQARETGRIEISDSVLGTSDVDALIKKFLVRQSGEIFLAVEESGITLVSDTELVVEGKTPAKETDSFLNLKERRILLTFAGTPGKFTLLVFLFKTLDNLDTHAGPSQAPAPLESDWTFSDSFPWVAGSAIDDLTFPEPYFLFTTYKHDYKIQKITNAEQESVSLEPGLNFASDLAADEGIRFLYKFVLQGTEPQLWLTGPVTPDIHKEETFEFAVPECDLRAYFPDVMLKLIGDYLKVGAPFIGVNVKYVVEKEGEKTEYGYIDSQAYFGAVFEIGDDETGAADGPGGEVRLELIASAPRDAYFLTVSLRSSEEYHASILKIASLFDGDTSGWTESIPGEIKSLLDTFGFIDFSVTISATSFKPVMMSLDVGSLEPWSPEALKKYFELEFYMNFSVLDPFDSDRMPSGLFTGILTYLGGQDQPEFKVEFSVPDFVIRGSYDGAFKFSLADIVKFFVPGDLSVPDDLLTFEFSDFQAALSPREKSFSFRFSTEIGFRLFGVDIFRIWETNVGIEASIVPDETFVPASSMPVPYDADNKLLVSAYVTGFVSIWELDFSVDGTISNDPDIDTVFQIQLVNKTLGDLVVLLVKMIDPNLDFSLQAPWSVLNAINLEDFVFNVNVTKGTVSITYNINLDLFFMSLHSVSLTYARVNGKGTVKFGLECDFLGQSYGKDKPLEWDLLNEAPPETPGMGDALFYLNYLGMGQHISFSDVKSFEHVGEVMKKLEDDFLPVDPDENPLAHNTGLQFDSGSNWLLGVDFILMGAVSLSLVFNDPDLYGIRIALAGEKVGNFAGLEFELLYKKVAEDIGMFAIELKLPDFMRRFELGQVSVTLGIIGVDIYTNGNFRIDMGFPEGTDFSRSFGLQFFPFVGSGGFYFAVLSGATSSNTPKISNGNFNPVLELGVGLALGLGKTIETGPLKAGFSLELMGIAEGCLGFFNPDNKAVNSEPFFYARGSVALVGKLYGYVDFKIIRIDLNVTAYASIALELEVYQPTIVTLAVRVTANAYIKVLFITLHFYFEIELNESFTIGSEGNPPWIIDRSPDRKHLLRGQRGLYMNKPFVGPRILADHMRSLRSAAHSFDWTPVNVFGGDTKTVSMKLLPAFTATSSPNPSPRAEEGDARIEGAMLLLVDNAIESNARSHKDILKTAANTADPGDPVMSFNRLVQGMLAWSVNALLHRMTGQVTASQLRVIYEELEKNTDSYKAFTYENLSKFIGMNYVFEIGGLPENPADAPETSGNVFPMIPDLTFERPDGPPVDFAGYNMVDPDYETVITDYFKELQVEYDANVVKPPRQTASRGDGAGGPGNEEEKESMAGVIFRDYFLMLARASVQAALDLLESYPYEVKEQVSLDDIAGSFSKLDAQYTTHAGDTYLSIISDTGMSAEALFSLNETLDLEPGDLTRPIEPGTPVNVQLGVKVGDIAAANASQQLQPGIKPGIGAKECPINYQVRTGDTLKSIAAHFGLADAVTLMETGGPERTNAENSAIPRTGAAMDVKNIPPFTVEKGDTLPIITAFFVVRNMGIYTDSNTGRLAQAVKEYNHLTVGFDEPLETGMELEIPDLGEVDPGTVKTDPYTVKEGDTIHRVTWYFLAARQYTAIESFQYEIMEKNPGVDFDKPLPVGTVLEIPDMIHTVKDSDTFTGICTTFNLALPDLVAANQTSPKILEPLGVFNIAGVTHTIAADETLASIAENYNFTVEELAGQIAAVKGIFIIGEKLTIPGVKTVDIQSLLTEVAGSPDCNNTACMVSRFFMNGLRLPISGDAAQKLAPLYELTGQQFPAPTFTAEKDYEIVFKNSGHKKWIQFITSRALGETDELIIKLTDDIVEEYPSVTFAPQILTPPAPLPLFNEVPVKYALHNHIHWQNAAPFSLPGVNEPNGGGRTGEPSIMFYPETLIDKISDPSQPEHRYRLGMQTDPINAFAGAAPGIKSYAWATMIKIDVRQPIEGESANTAIPNGCIVLGADEPGRDALLGLWSYLDGEPGKEDNAVLYILYSPHPTRNENYNGLMSDNTDRKKTLLLKTNLSTLTHSGPRDTAGNGPEPPPRGRYYAAVEAAKEFMKFLWEASIVGTGGFYLNYVKHGDKTGLPANLFMEDGKAALWVLVLLDSQAKKQDRTLHHFNNSVVIADNIDASGANIFAEVTDKSDLTKVSSVPAGNVGFHLLRKNPGIDPVSAKQKTRTLYSLLGYRVRENDFFTSSREGLPVEPKPGTRDDKGGVTRVEYLREEEDEWYYNRVFPAYKFAKENPLPRCDALPDKAKNPYAGIPGITGGALNSIDVKLEFHDVLGNILRPVEPLKNVPIPVGYTDEIIGPCQWPGTGISYEILPRAGEPAVVLHLENQISDYVPGPGGSYENALQNASTHALRYKQAYYQVQCKDLNFHLTTSLDRKPGEEPRKYPLEKKPLANLVSASYMFLSTCEKLIPWNHPIAPGETLQAISAVFHVSLADIGTANRDGIENPSHGEPVTAADLFENLEIPRFHVVRFGETLEEIAEQYAVEPLALVKYNMTEPLTAGLAVEIDPKQYTVKQDDTDKTLEDISLHQLCTVVGIAKENETTQHILSPGVKLVFEDVTIAVIDPDTFKTVTEKFRVKKPAAKLEDIAYANRNTENIFRKDAVIAINDYIIQSGEDKETGVNKNTFQYLGSLFPLAGLVDRNKSIQTLYAQGACLVVPGGKQYPPEKHETLGSIAAKFGVTVEQLVLANRSTPLKTGTSALLRIPYIASIDASAESMFVPYQVKEADTLQAISANFARAPVDMATLNRELPGLFYPGQPITIKTVTITTSGSDSFVSLIAEFKDKGIEVTLEELADTVATRHGLMRAGELLAAPLPKVGARSLSTLASDYNIGNAGQEPSAVNLALANSALHGFLKPGAEVVLGKHSIIAGPHDTPAILVNRFFDEQEITTTVAAIAEANKDGDLLNPGSPFILPPNPVSIAVKINTTPTPNFPDAVFKVNVNIRVNRAAHNVSPGFEDVNAVKTSVTAVPPKVNLDADGNESALSLLEFAGNFEAAFPALKIATGKKKDPSEADEKKIGNIWAVNFGKQGIENFVIRRDKPVFFALKPLSTELISKDNVPIRPYVSREGLGEPRMRNFQGIDLDTLAGEFLAAVDLFLSPEYAIPAFGQDKDSFETVVSAKKNLAEAIKKGVVPVLKKDEEISRDKLEAAREALYQRLLINLSDAYSTDCLIQYPTAVNSKYTDPKTAPRFSGRPHAMGYITGKKDNIPDIAGYLKVSELNLVETIQNVTKILETGLVVEYRRQGAEPVTYKIEPGDSLSIIKSDFEKQSGLLINWSQFIQGLRIPEGKALFAPSRVINISAVSHFIDHEDTFETIAQYFNISVKRLGHDIQDVDGIFKEGELKYKEKTVTVTPGNNSVRKIAAAFGISPEELVEYFRQKKHILMPGTRLYVLQFIPEHSFSTAKIPLADGSSDVTFLCNLESAEKYKKLFFDLDYVINEMEHDIKDVEHIEDYQASSWLGFVIPMAAGGKVVDTHIGQVEVPFPLRCYPTPPSLVAQAGIASNEEASTVKEAKLWDYSLTFEQTSAAQDLTYLEVNFNVPGGEPVYDAGRDDLFANLEQFFAVYPDVISDLSILLQPDFEVDEVTSVAVKTFAELVDNVAKSWQTFFSNALKKPLNTKTYKYEMNVTTRRDTAMPDQPGEILLETLVLKWLSHGVAEPQWPEIYLVTKEKDILLDPHVASEYENVYYYPESPPVQAFASLTQKFVYKKRDIMADQNASGAVYVTRNERLLSTETAGDFLYKTSEVRFANLMTPLIEANCFIEINKDLRKALIEVFGELFTDPDQVRNIKLVCRYGYQIVTPTAKKAKPIITMLPVLLQPKYLLKHSEIGNFVEKIAKEINEWEKGQPVEEKGGKYYFRLEVFSALDESQAKPLLSLSNIAVPKKS